MSGVAILIAIGTTRPAAATGDWRMAGDDRQFEPPPRVRTANPTLRALMGTATERSETFRTLVRAIDATDGIVYIEHGRCPGNARACLPHAVTISGSDRILWILVDTRMPEENLMGSIGHELQHAVEVLSNRTLTTGKAIQLYYRFAGKSPGIGMFETAAAVRAGSRVRAEVRAQH
jgi:hypothetical protein